MSQIELSRRGLFQWAGIKTLDAALRSFPAVLPTADTPTATYTVLPGDTLSVIAQRYGLTIDEIVDFNRTRNPTLAAKPDFIIPGWSLKVAPERSDLYPYRDKITSYCPLYYKSARANIVPTYKDRRALLPSAAYGEDIYLRDTVYTVLGLDDPKLAKELLPWFEEYIQPPANEVATSIHITPELWKNRFWPDESNLLFATAYWWLAKKGFEINKKFAEMIYNSQHIRGQAWDGYFWSYGTFASWLDTMAVPAPDVISYNQGLYAVATKCLDELGIKILPGEVDRSRQRYAEFFDPNLGYMRFSKKLPFADSSAIFPEIFHRWLFGSGILTDDIVKKAIRQRIKIASVFDKNGKFIGLKNISQSDGSFVPQDYFTVKPLTNPGDYQNGAVWPLWTAAELSLLYAISEDPLEQYRIVKMIASMMDHELGRTGKSQEYLKSTPGEEGIIVDIRQGYSWNALIPPLLKWAGITKPRFHSKNSMD